MLYNGLRLRCDNEDGVNDDDYDTSSMLFAKLFILLAHSLPLFVILQCRPYVSCK